MKAKEFIISHLKDFTEEFRSAKVRYGYDTMAQMHIIVILPQSVFDSKDFLDWECDMYDKFVHDYPGEVIGFLSEDALVGIETFDFEFEGSLYDSFTTNPSSVFAVPMVSVKVSSFMQHSLTLSVSDAPTKENFEETLLNNEEFLDNYKLAA